MPEFALHILDLVRNSIDAGAKLVFIRIAQDTRCDRLTVEITDDGCGMSEDAARCASDPFMTGRTGRRVGLGLALVSQLAEMTGGSFSLQSKEGEGTRLKLEFCRSHPDLPPMGDLPGTFSALFAAGETDFVIEYRRDEQSFATDTRMIRSRLAGVPLDSPEVISWAREYLSENIMEVDSI